MVKKLLIIEDSPTVLGMLKDMFEQEGYEVIPANSGEEGVKKTVSETPDLVITDTMLPGINGFEACRRIREIQSPGKPKIIVMTGSVDAVDEGKARAAGADDYIMKTSDFSYLLGAVKKFS